MSTYGNLDRHRTLRVAGVVLTLATLVLGLPGVHADAVDGDVASVKPAATNGPLLEVFDEVLPAAARWEGKTPEKIVRDGGGFAGKRWAYMQTRDGPIAVLGLSIRVREKPGPGEYRYLSFAWKKWGDGQIAMQIERDKAADGERRRGELHGYRYDAGEGPAVGGQSLRLSEVAPHEWTETTRDLWKDFGDITITGITFVSVGGRDAAIDRIYLAQSLAGFQGMPPTYRETRSAERGGDGAPASANAPIVPAQVVAPVDADMGEGPTTAPAVASAGKPAPVVLHSDVKAEQVTIDWWKQIMSGGWTMIPLLLLSVAGVVISVQRLLTIREVRIAPPELAPAVRQAMARGDVAAALAECDRNPSTLAEALRFIVEHRQNDVQVVNQAAGDIAARDIRDHMSRIYPLSVIASLAPLLGLLGTIIGMIEAFALVSIYGDEGGATILSGSISKALITTAAGLIIAIPAIAVYYVIKNRLMRIASLVEIALEDLIAALYLKKHAAPGAPAAAGGRSDIGLELPANKQAVVVQRSDSCG